MIPILLLALGLRVGSIADFVQWDNLEVYLPWILSGHRRLLQGDIPLWNPFQNMGEPLYAMGPGGIFYFPYTMCTWLVDVLGRDPRSVLNLVAVMHVGLAGIGLYRLCRSFSVRPLLAMIAGISGAMNGYALIVGAVWIHVLPVLAWSVWALWGAKELVDGQRPRRALIVLTLALAMTLAVGHIQAALYTWMFTGLFAGAYAVQRKCFTRRMPWVAASALAAGLLAMPTILPTAALLPDSDRAVAVRPEVFGFRGVAPRALLGLLLPSLGGDDGFLEVGSLSSTHLGAWLVPTLMAALGIWSTGGDRRRKRRGPERDSTPDDLSPGLVLNAALAMVVVALSLGSWAPFYGWTYGIPIWSNFRWPFKLYQHAVPSLIVAGAIGLELLVRHPAPRSRRVFFIAAALVTSLLWVLYPGLTSPSAIVAGLSGLVAIVALAWIDTAGGRAALTCAVILQGESLLLMTHRPDRFKTYAQERVGAFGPEQFGIDTAYRVLPVSPSIPEGDVMQELGLFHSATLGGYSSLTGHRMALTSQRLRQYLPTSAEGLLPRAMLPEFLQSHLMRSFNTRYVLAAQNDTGLVGYMNQLPGYRRISETRRAIVYSNGDALPRLFFATEVHPFEPRELRRRLVENASPATCALAAGTPRLEGALPPARVAGWHARPELVAADLAAPQGGFLVISMSYSPDWIATIDGRSARLRITDGAIMGLEVPPGSKHAVIRYEPPSYRRSLWWSLLGWGALAGAVLTLSLGDKGSRTSGDSASGSRRKVL